MARISIPTTARLSSSLHVNPSNPAVAKILGRLSRASLISIALDWLDERNLPLAAPYLRREDTEEEDDDEEDFYPPADSPAALQELYTELQGRKGSKKDVLDRITQGDWRHGLSLYQLAMADLQHLYDHPTSQTWSAYRIVPLKTPPRDAEEDAPPVVDKESLTVPRFHPSTFLNTLQAQVLPDVKAHYNFDRHKELPLLLLRIFILDSPYNTSLGIATSNTPAAANFDMSRTVYIAFPDASPHIFISKPQTLGSPAAGVGGGEVKSLRNLIVEGIPKALSRPRHRITLNSTSLTTKNLVEMLDKRGAKRTNSAGGGWSIYADEKIKDSPLDTVLPTPPLSERDEEVPIPEDEPASRKRALSPGSQREERTAKRARLVARARFGKTARPDDGKGIERVDVVIEDPFPQDTGEESRHRSGEDDEGSAAPPPRRSKAGGGGRSQFDADLDSGMAEDEGPDQPAQKETGGWRPNVRLTFHGTHVFAGIRQLVEGGIIDGERMPGWMTGEEGITVGAVRNGRIRGHKGSGV